MDTGSMVIVLDRLAERYMECHGGPRRTLGGSLVAGALVERNGVGRSRTLFIRVRALRLAWAEGPP